MAGFAGFFGSRKRERAVATPANGPTPRGESVLGASGAPMDAVASDWLMSGLAPDGGATGSHPSSELVIHARRAGEIAPTPQPSSAA